MTRNENAKFDPNAIPAELKDCAQWVLWRYEEKREGQKSSKIPYQTNFKRASTGNPNTWNTFAKVLQAWQASPDWFDGIGFVLTEDDPFWGVDFDYCLANDGSLLEWARDGVEILRGAGAYIEVSPSGRGLKAFFRCTLKSQRGRRRAIENDPLSAIEVYSKGRYFTVTGQPFEDQLEALGDATEAFGRFSSWVDTITKPAPRTPAKVLQGEVVSSTPAPQTWSTTGRPDAHERARLFANKYPPAISGQKGHDATFRLACVLVRGFALGIDGARPILEEWSQGCQPPWNATELEHKLSQAEKSVSELGWMLKDAPDVNFSGQLEPIQTIQLAVAIPRDDSHLPSNWDEITHVDQALLDQLKRRVHSFSDMMLGVKLAKEQLKNQTRSALKPLVLPEPPEGFLRDFTRWQLETAQKPQPAFALFGSITLQSVLIGRKVKLGDAYETRPNIMALILGNTSSGKNHAMRQITKIISEAGAGQLLAGTPTSDSALYREIGAASTGKLWLADEFGQFLKTTSMENGGAHAFAVRRALLELFTSADNPIYRCKVYADPKNNIQIGYPFLSLYAVSTPDGITDTIRFEDIEGGLVGRLLLVGGDERPEHRKPKPTPPPPHLVEIVKKWFAYGPGGNLSANFGGNEKTIPMSREAEFLLEVFQRESNETVAMAIDKADILWARAAEKAGRLALISACSRITDPASDTPHVSEADCRWAISTVRAITEWTLGLVQDSISENKQEATVKKVLKIIREAGKSGIMKGDLTRKLQNLERPRKEQIIRDLIESRQVVCMSGSATSGAPGERFVCTEFLQ
jgi:hypothetical protein